jgi:hypothetical protein
MKRSKKMAAFGLVASFGLIAAACGGDDDADTTTAPTDTEAEGGTGEAVCPSNLVIQTDWWPEVEHGGSYQLIGPGGTTDPSLFTYSGPIAEKYKVGGIETVEVRAGGDAIEFQPVVSVMQTDRDITLGYVNTDDIVQSSAAVQTTGVAATLEVNPQMLMWDPTQLDIDPSDPASIGESGARILHFPGVTYMDWMIGKGYISADQSDPNYGGAPDQWIAEGGDFIQQGFYTNEVYKYENLIEWKDGAPADIEAVLIHELGWQPYPAMYSVLTERLEELSPCLEVLVPVLQQAWVDFLDDPKPMGDALVDIAGDYNNYWTISPELNDAAYELFDGELGIGGNGSDDTYGNFDLERVENLYDELLPVLEELGIDIADGLTVDQVVTNEFIDTSIGR